MSRRSISVTLAAFVALFVAVAGSLPEASALTNKYSLVRLGDPGRTVVRDGNGAWVATLTDGARTVALAGPRRRFTETSASHAVTSTTWVRILPTPFAGAMDVTWLEAARADTSPDVLAVAAQFLSGKPDRFGPDGALLAADASYGPPLPDGTRQEGADWNDFRGVAATYADGVDEPEADQYRGLDCSGFVRMVWGKRSGIPLTRQPDRGRSLPRRAVHQAAEAPGVTPIPDTGRQVKSFDRLQPGDLVFFDASTEDGSAIDHVGLYLGLDDAGHHRFVSSRKSADGPTLGDLRGRSILDGTGLYAKSFRSTRRL